MGKASKWFRGLLGFKKSEPSRSPAQKPPPAKKRWSFAKSNKEKDHRKSPSGGATGGGDDDEASRHALAVAAATAAVAEAAVAAAQAAAAVVKLTSGGGFNSVAGVSQSLACYGSREERAAVMIQSHFRAYLSRKALRALKALVQLQALVRGQLLRKQYMDKLRQIVWAQARARAGRPLISEVALSSAKSSPINYTERLDHTIQARSLKQEQQMMLKRNGSKSNGNIAYDSEKSHLIRHRTDRRVGERSSEQGSFTRIIHTDDERSDKILEVDTWKPHQHVAPKRRSIFHSPHLSQSSDQHCQTFSMSSAHQTTGLSPSSSSEVQSMSLLKFALDVDGNAFSTAENSPQYYSASSMGGGSSRRAPFTPTRSDGSRSCLSGYSDHPSYMAYTESSKAKVRSVSAPKQRPQYERSSSTNRYSVYAYSDSRPNYTQKASTLNGNFANRAYPGSGRLDRLGMPVVSGGLSGGHWHRY